MRVNMTAAVVLFVTAAASLVAAPDAEHEKKIQQVVDDMKAKLDRLANVEVEYELHNKITDNKQKIKLLVRDFHALRLESDMGVYLVNDGNLLFYSGKVGQKTNIKELKRECLDSTGEFWEKNEAEFRKLPGCDPAALRAAILQSGVYPAVSMRVTPAADYTSEKPQFSFRLSAGLVGEASAYSWLEDLRALARDNEISMYEKYVKVANPQVEFWVYKDTGLLYQEKLLGRGGRVEATLTCLGVVVDAKLDPEKFELKAPEGVELKDLSEANRGMIYMDLVSGFFEELAKTLLKSGWTPEKDAACDRSIQSLTREWMAFVYGLNTPRQQRDESVEKTATEFAKIMDEVYAAETSAIQAQTRAYDETKKLLDRIRGQWNELDDAIRAHSQLRLRGALKGLEGDQKTLEAMKIVFGRGIDEAFAQVYEAEFFGVLRARIKQIQEDYEKRCPVDKPVEKPEEKKE